MRRLKRRHDVVPEFYVLGLAQRGAVGQAQGKGAQHRLCERVNRRYLYRAIVNLASLVGRSPP